MSFFEVADAALGDEPGREQRTTRERRRICRTRRRGRLGAHGLGVGVLVRTQTEAFAHRRLVDRGHWRHDIRIGAGLPDPSVEALRSQTGSSMPMRARRVCRRPRTPVRCPNHRAQPVAPRLERRPRHRVVEPAPSASRSSGQEVARIFDEQLGRDREAVAWSSAAAWIASRIGGGTRSALPFQLVCRSLARPARADLALLRRVHVGRSLR